LDGGNHKYVNNFGDGISSKDDCGEDDRIQLK
jgi:hypothetical protein